MISFSSQIGTKSAQNELVPFGWTRSEKRLLDSIADFERDRAAMEAQSFGRRREIPARAKTGLPAKPVCLKAPAEVFPSRIAAATLLLPHPSSIKRRERP